MFNQNFYPTPPTLIRKMIAPLYLREHGDAAYVLEPSAGKGDILDVLAERTRNLYAIEIEPELQAILRDKGYPVLAQDFLKYEPNIHFTHIIMNPPFDAAEKHLLHAWNILYEGEIVAVMPKTALQAKDRFEQNVARLVADHGEVEDVGRAFVGAERSTNVEVCIVRLHKKATGGETLEFDVQNDRADPDFGESTANELALRGFIANLLGNFNAAVGNYAAYNQAREKITRYVAPFGRVWQGDRSVDILESSDDLATPQARYNRFIQLMQDAAWSKILDHPSFQAILTERARNMMKDFRQQQRRMDFNEHNIRAMFEALVAKQTELLDAAILDAFDTMTKYHKENRIYFEGWKSNECWRVNRKVVLPYYIERWETGSFHIRWGNEPSLTDIDRALCVVMNQRFDSILTVSQALRNAFERSSEPGKTYSTFFEIRYFKKGTIHLHFLDEEVWKQFNYRAARARNWLPPGTPAPAARAESVAPEPTPSVSATLVNSGQLVLV